MQYSSLSLYQLFYESRFRTSIDPALRSPSGVDNCARILSHDPQITRYNSVPTILLRCEFEHVNVIGVDDDRLCVSGFRYHG